MKPNPWVFILFSLVMGIIIIISPYIITLFNRFNRERLLIWRKFLIIVFACYIPIIAILYAVCIVLPRDIGPKILLPWWIGYYFGYIVFTILVKKHTNLQLGWFKFIILSTAGYLTATFLLVFLASLFCDPLVSLFAYWTSVSYITSP